MNPEPLDRIGDRPSTDFSRVSDESTGLMMLGDNTNGNRVVGSPRRDILDSTNGQVDQVLGQGGRDRLVAGKRDKLYGGKGNDRLDARDGKGRNYLFGEKGRDRLFAKRKDWLFGNQDNDVLSSRNGKGQNTLKGGQGNDDLIAGKRDRLFGGVGEDVLDASTNGGNNELWAGAGNDQLYGGVNDQLNGGDGDDLLWAGMGGSQLTGGRGGDQFWIVNGTLPDDVNTITDFEAGVDQVAIAGLDGVTDITQLTLTQDGAGTVIAIQGVAIAVLNDVTPDQLSDDDFIFAAPVSKPETDGTVTTTVTLVSRAAKFDNEMGYFFVDDVQGRIDGLLPGADGYAAKALERSQVLFTADQEPGTSDTIDIPDQQYLGWYLIQDATTQQFQSLNPENELSEDPLIFFSFPDANPDGDVHLDYRSSTELGWEDLTNGGDRSFDDLVFKVEQTVVSPVPPIPPTPPPPPPQGSISGFKWNDLNGDGIRNVLIQGTSPEIVFAIDVSLSAADPFQGTLAGNGDVNGDGASNTRLDAELAGFIELNNQLIEQGLDDANVGIVVFAASAASMDMDPFTPEVDLVVSPMADNNGNGISDVEDILRSIDIEEGNVLSGTDFARALQGAQATFAELGTPPDTGNLIFLSDGDHNRFVTYDNEVSALDSLGVNLTAFGVGTDANLNSLQIIDPDAQIFTNTDELIGFFSGVTGQSGLQEPGLAGVTIYIDENNNGLLDPDEPSTVTVEDDPATDDIDETGQYTFTNLSPGTYTIREVVPPGAEQTFPLPTSTIAASIFDGEFADSDWTTTSRIETEGANLDFVDNAQQQLTGGNPDAYRRMTHQWGSGTQVVINHKYENFIYDPSVQGEFEGINYSDDRILFEPFVPGDVVGRSMAIFQGGDVFRLTRTSDIPEIPGFGNTEWQTLTLNNLQASDFVSLTTGNSPDFSESGSPLQFGYQSSNTIFGSTRTVEHGIDNWSVTLVDVDAGSYQVDLGMDEVVEDINFGNR